MKWTNHKLFGFAVGILVTGNPVAGVVSAVASIFPDSIEGFRDRKFLKHRGNSHSLVIWSSGALATASIAYFGARLPQWPPEVSATMIMTVIFWGWLGICSHLLGDMMTISGIPKPFGKGRLAMKWFRTGDPIEYVIAAGSLAGAICIRWWQTLQQWL